MKLVVKYALLIVFAIILANAALSALGVPNSDCPRGSVSAAGMAWCK